MIYKDFVIETNLLGRQIVKLIDGTYRVFYGGLLVGIRSSLKDAEDLVKSGVQLKKQL